MEKVKNQRRHQVSHVPAKKRRGGVILIPGHDAAVHATSLFGKTYDPLEYPHKMLKSGQNSKKIGRIITKGPWQGFPIYTLTLEESGYYETFYRKDFAGELNGNT